MLLRLYLKMLIDKAVEQAIASKYRNAGQTCVCANRLYVHESVADAFSKKYILAVKRLKVGDGLQDGVQIGPLIDGRAIEKVKNHIADAVQKGGKIETGGSELSMGGGYFFEPTVLTKVTDDILCMNEETFGPLAPITTFSSTEEVIRRANNSPYGLAAYVFTQNITKAIVVCEQFEYGFVGLNDGLPSVAQAPFGGYKQSGLGSEGDITELKNS